MYSQAAKSCSCWNSAGESFLIWFAILETEPFFTSEMFITIPNSDLLNLNRFSVGYNKHILVFATNDNNWRRWRSKLLCFFIHDSINALVDCFPVLLAWLKTAQMFCPPLATLWPGKPQLFPTQDLYWYPSFITLPGKKLAKALW